MQIFKLTMSSSPSPAKDGNGSEERQEEEETTSHSTDDSATVTSTNGASGPVSGDYSSDSWSNSDHNDRHTVDVTGLPKTVTVLEAPGGGRVFLVGTAHFSEASNQDVETTIRKVQPDIVVLELCKSRLPILSLDEKTLLEESSNLSFDKVHQNIKDQGLVQGVMYTLLLSLSAHLTRELGMSPGGEFRRAFKEAKRIPGCRVHLGDRPVHLTLRRAISSLSFWQKTKLGCSILFSKESISKEEVEKCKDRDLLHQMLADITGEYPALSRVLVDERDTFLTYSLQTASLPVRDVWRSDQPTPTRVVGVVGMGHVPGIVRKWGSVRDSDIPDIMSLPEQTWTSFLLLKGVKYSVNGLLLVGAYRYLLPSSIKSVCRSSASLAWNNVVTAVKASAKKP